MNDDFKNKLLSLYPFYDRVTGPYTRSDKRQHLCLNNSSLPKGDTNKLRTLSYPKALLEVKLNRLLSDNETADHKDEDLTNNDIDNLQVLTRVANIVKSFNLNPERHEKYSKHICPQCNSEFVILTRQVRANNIKQKKAGPFCSRRCSGLRNQKLKSV